MDQEMTERETGGQTRGPWGGVDGVLMCSFRLPVCAHIPLQRFLIPSPAGEAKGGPMQTSWDLDGCWAELAPLPLPQQEKGAVLPADSHPKVRESRGGQDGTHPKASALCSLESSAPHG